MAAIVHEFFRFGFYKRSQGRIARLTTFYALVLIVLVGCWSMSNYYMDKDPLLHYYLPLAFAAIGLWISFRVVQMPAFADFLISVEGEMNKVSWPSRSELFRATLPKNDIDMWAVYDAIRCPTLVIRGASSDLLARKTAEEMTRRGPKARVVEIPEVGHAPSLMHADQIAVVRDFLLEGDTP